MEINIKSTITIVMTFVIGVILIAGVLIPIIADNTGSNESSGETYTNTGYPMKELKDFRDMGAGYRYTLTNCSLETDPLQPDSTVATPTYDLHIYEYTNGGTNETVIENNDTDEIVHIPLIVSENITMIWEIDNTISPQGNFIFIYNSEDTSDMRFSLMFDDNDTGSFNIDIWYDTDNREIVGQVTTDPQSGGTAAQFNFPLSSGYIYYPNGKYVMTDATEEGVSIHWSNEGLAMIFDSTAIFVTDLPTMQEAWMYTDGSTDDLAYMFNEDGVETTIYTEEITTTDGISTVNAKLTVDYDVKTDGVGLMSVEPGYTSYENMYCYLLPATVGDSGGSSNGTVDAMLYLIPIVLIAGMIILGIRTILKR